MLVLATILLPIIFGLILPLLKLNKSIRNIYVIIVSLITSFLSLYIAFKYDFTTFTLLNLTKVLSIGFKIDGLSKIFLLILSCLWPIAIIYSTEYMNHEENQDDFFKYYLIAFGIALGLSFSKNLITMYLFYELLTFLTLPLIMHNFYDKRALYAGKIYLIVSVLGASLALIGIIIYIFIVPNIEFVYGGNIEDVVLRNNEFLINIAYILCFIGFGVKAAVLPFTYWLPTCSVAPTPVSALLHAVAVVKAGVFAIMRTTYYIFGTSVLIGGFAQKVTMIITILTILYGSIMALKEKNIKRRLAYSTASNLAYILFVTLLFTPNGFSAGLSHMIFHALMKINLFFIAGAFIIYGNIENVDEVKGISKKMPIEMFSFIIASLSMIGIPLTCGFISKYKLITACIYSNSLLAIVGMFSIIISAILTLIYLFSIVVNAYISKPDDINILNNVSSSGNKMKFTFILLTIFIIYFGINSNSLISFIDNISFAG